MCVCVTLAAAAHVDVASKFPWVGEPLMQVFKKMELDTSKTTAELAESIVAVGGLFESGITTAVENVKQSLLKAKLSPSSPSDGSALLASLVSLKQLLSGREKLYKIAESAIEKPFDTSAWTSAEGGKALAHQVDAVRIAKQWDQLNGEYSAALHDNATIAAVAAVSSFKLASSDRYAELAVVVDRWSLYLNLAQELMSPDGFMYGEKKIKFDDLNAAMKDYVKKDLLQTPHSEVTFHVGKDILELPATHPLIMTTTTTTTSTTTITPPTRAPEQEDAFYDIVPPELVAMLRPFYSQTPTTTPAKPSVLAYMSNGKMIGPSDWEFWNPEFEDKGLWKGRSLLIGH